MHTELQDCSSEPGVERHGRGAVATRYNPCDAGLLVLTGAAIADIRLDPL